MIAAPQWIPRVPTLSTSSYLDVIRQADGNGGSGRARDGVVTSRELNLFGSQLDRQLQSINSFRNLFGGMFGGLFDSMANRLQQQRQATTIMQQNFSSFANNSGNGTAISISDVLDTAGRDGNRRSISRSDVLNARPLPPIVQEPTPEPQPDIQPPTDPAPTTPVAPPALPTQGLPSHKVAAELLKDISPDGSYSFDELKKAASSDRVKGSIYAPLFEGIAAQVELTGREFTAADLEKLALGQGGDEWISLEELADLPKVVGMADRPVRADGLASYMEVTGLLRKQSPDGDFTFDEIKRAAADPDIQNTPYQQILEGLAAQVELNGRPLTAADLQKLAAHQGGDQWITLEQVADLPKAAGWPEKPLRTDGLASYMDVTSIMRRHSEDGSYTFDELKKASADPAIQNTPYQQILEGLAANAELHGRPVTASDLQKLASLQGGDQWIGLEQVADLPQAAGWPAKSIKTSGLPSYMELTQILRKQSDDGSYSFDELKKAAAGPGVQNTPYQQVLESLAANAELHGRPVTASDLQKLAKLQGGDQWVSLEQVADLPQAAGWEARALRTEGLPSYLDVTAIMREFSPNDGSYSANELTSAANSPRVQGTVYAALLNELAKSSQANNREVTASDLQKLAAFRGGDQWVALNEIADLKTAAGW